MEVGRRAASIYFGFLDDSFRTRVPRCSSKQSFDTFGPNRISISISYPQLQLEISRAECSQHEQLSRMNMSITSENRNEWTRPEFWTSICKNLSIEAEATYSAVPKVADGCPTAKYRELLRKRGYAQVNELMPEFLISKLRAGIKQLREHNLPASFILLFDETWQLARVSRQLLEKSTLETNEFQFDILAWCIEHGGFTPHRDRQPENARSTIGENGDAKFVTNWIALTESSPENSCLYVIPKEHDPGYMDGDSDDQDPLQRALPNKQAFQNIRALPREPGQSLLFTHRLIHWGSIKDPDASPRIALSFVCSDPSYEKPYIDPGYFTEDKMPPFSIRLLLICAQLLVYYQRFDLTTECLRACYEYCKSMKKELEVSYRHKVFVEFVKAMKEGTDDECDDDDEAMMEEMLEAEQAGYGEFEDDFDKLGAEGDDCKVGMEEDGDASSDDEDEEADLFGSSNERMELRFGKREASGVKDSTLITNKRVKRAS